MFFTFTEHQTLILGFYCLGNAARDELISRRIVLQVLIHLGDFYRLRTIHPRRRKGDLGITAIGRLTEFYRLWFRLK